MTVYTEKYYAEHGNATVRSANAIVPLIMDAIAPSSIVDVGCGTGTWLRTFRQHGIRDIHGIDGEYAATSSLEISLDEFTSADLSQPFSMDRQFDLVVSLEVAEHLPKASASVFVDSLVGLGPIVLFSAAIPGQGGELHINEQWPAYWAELFQARGFTAVDYIRKRIWLNDSISWWYAQNMILYVKDSRLLELPRLQRDIDPIVPVPLPLVHPRAYLGTIERMQSWQDLGRRIARRVLPKSAQRFVKDWLRERRKK